MTDVSNTPKKRKGRTNRQCAQHLWEHEDWGEPRDEEQERLWIAFFTDSTDGDAWYTAKGWARPRAWVEELVRR